jgi:hypothetical protein
MKRSILILGAIFFLVAGGVFADKAADSLRCPRSQVQRSSH